MKKSLLFIATLLILVGHAQTAPNFTITNTSGTNYITCVNPSVNYVANGNSNLTYLWVSSSATLSGSSVSITVPGTYSVTATDTLNNSLMKMLSVLINTVLPISTVSPNIQSITCSSPTTQFIIIVSPTPGNPFPANQTQSITSQYGGSYILNSNASFVYQATAPGTYTYLQIDNNNGCSVVKHFTVTAAAGFPTFSITSPQNFTLGCTTKSVAVINIVNAQTTPTPGGVISYSLFGGFGATSSYSITSPGIYTVAVKDNGTNCITQIPFSVLQNTTAPNLSVSVPKQILDCTTSQVILNGSSTTPNVTYQWNFIGTPGTAIGNTISVQSNSVAPSSTLINTYTLIITDNSSTCKSTSIIPIYQNTFKPNAAISSGSNNAITCLTPTILLVNVSTTGIPASTGFPISQPVIGSLWSGPTNLINSSTYPAQSPGIYTLEALDLNNGCKSQTTIVISDNRVYPNINMPGSYFLACPGIVTISAMIVGSGAGYTYVWTSPNNATTTSSYSSTLTTNSPGYYTLAVTNTLNSCSSTATTVVQACVGVGSNLNENHEIRIFPNPTSGIFTIITENARLNKTIEIYNMLGELINVEPLSSDKNTIDLQYVPNGIYLLQILENKKVVSSQKIIKQ